MLMEHAFNTLGKKHHLYLDLGLPVFFFVVVVRVCSQNLMCAVLNSRRTVSSWIPDLIDLIIHDLTILEYYEYKWVKVNYSSENVSCAFRL